MATLITPTHNFSGTRRPARPIGSIVPFRGHTRGMGDATSVGTTAAGSAAQGADATAAINSFTAQLTQAGQDLQSLANAAASNATIAAAIQVQLQAAQQQFNTVFSQYTSSLSSAWNLLPPVAVYNAIVQSNLASQAQALLQSIAAMKAQVASIATQNVGITQGSATQYAALAASAYAEGDQATGDYWSGLAASAQTTAASQANPSTPAPSTDFLQWIEDNAVWIGIGAAVLFLGPSLIKKL